MSWESAFANHVGNKGYLRADVYAEIARAINDRRAYIGQPLTNFTHLGTNPEDNALVSVGSDWPRDIVADVLEELKDSIEWCATNPGEKNNRSYHWVEIGPPMVRYGTTKRTEVEGDPGSIYEWKEVVGCIWEIIDGLTDIWTLAVSCLQTHVITHYRRLPSNASVYYDYHYPDGKPWDWVNNYWGSQEDGICNKVIKNSWGNIEVPIFLKFNNRVVTYNEGHGVWTIDITTPGGTVYHESIGDNSQNLDVVVPLGTTPPNEDIHLSMSASFSLIGDWIYEYTYQEDPPEFYGQSESRHYLEARVVDARGTPCGCVLNLGGVPPWDPRWLE